mmetsp:Transcript_30746/g.55954  ORF Transcript_30746/g.55954 Transcript_30746/m.55954 type:complete len:354 (+) Transcript_30746:569-1630(+)
MWRFRCSKDIAACVSMFSLYRTNRTYFLSAPPGQGSQARPLEFPLPLERLDPADLPPGTCVSRIWEEVEGGEGEGKRDGREETAILPLCPSPRPFPLSSSWPASSPSASSLRRFWPTQAATAEVVVVVAVVGIEVVGGVEVVVGIEILGGVEVVGGTAAATAVETGRVALDRVSETRFGKPGCVLKNWWILRRVSLSSTGLRSRSKGGNLGARGLRGARVAAEEQDEGGAAKVARAAAKESSRSATWKRKERRSSAREEPAISEKQVTISGMRSRKEAGLKETAAVEEAGVNLALTSVEVPETDSVDGFNEATRPRRSTSKTWKSRHLCFKIAVNGFKSDIYSVIPTSASVRS